MNILFSSRPAIRALFSLRVAGFLFLLRAAGLLVLRAAGPTGGGRLASATFLFRRRGRCRSRVPVCFARAMDFTFRPSATFDRLGSTCFDRRFVLRFSLRTFSTTAVAGGSGGVSNLFFFRG